MIQPDTMEQIIKSQQEQISSLLTTNRSLVESNEKLLKQIGTLQHKIQELLSQIAWLNRQLFGRKSEKLAALDPNQLSLFDCTPVASPDADTHDTSGNGILPVKIRPDGKRRKPAVTANCWKDFLL